MVKVLVLFLRMVVWQPFDYCWRLIIARVSEMHVAYHTRVRHVGCLFIGMLQQQHNSHVSYVYHTRTCIIVRVYSLPLDDEFLMICLFS